MTKRERSTRRRQRAKARVLDAIDWAMRGTETLDAFERGTRVHQEIERVLKSRDLPFVGDCHVGMINQPPLAGLHQASAYVVMGGDLVQHNKRSR